MVCFDSLRFGLTRLATGRDDGTGKSELDNQQGKNKGDYEDKLGALFARLLDGESFCRGC